MTTEQITQFIPKCYNHQAHHFYQSFFKAFQPLVERAVTGERNVLQASIINVSTIMSSTTLSPNMPFFSYDYQCSKAALNMFTFKGGELIHNFITGVGGGTGLQHGEVSSPVAASKLINWGYAGVGVYNPYRSVILLSEEVINTMF